MSAEEIVKYSQLLYHRGHLTLLSGNLSARVGGHIVVTPTSYPKPFLTAEDLVWLDLEGNVVKGFRRPTSEWRLHLEIYKRRPDVGAIVHTHTVLPTLLAEKIEIGLLSEAEAYLGSDIAVVPYIQPGTLELARATAEAMERSNVAVLKRHGLVAVGRDMAEAVNRIEVLTDLARATFYKLLLVHGVPA